MTQPSLASDIGQLVVLGWPSNDPTDPTSKKIVQYIRDGAISGAILFRHNIVNPEQLRTLIAPILEASTPPPFTMIDQEGGKVARISSKNGFKDFGSHKWVAQNLAPIKALQYYSELGEMLFTAGFNFDFAPCVDIDFDPPSPAIGAHERSFGAAFEKVTTFSQSMIRGLRQAGMVTCAKHYPGHGSAQGDTHEGLVDITSTWRPEELLPYQKLCASGDLDAVMTAHVVHKGFDSGMPATFSPVWLGKLREEIGFEGVIVTDDLHMGAIQKNYPFEDTILLPLIGGADLLCLSNNPLAAKGVDGFSPDMDLPEKVHDVITKGVKSGKLSTEKIARSAERVRTLRNGLNLPKNFLHT